MKFNPDRRQALKTIGGAGLLLAGGAGVASARGPPSEGTTIVDIAAGSDSFDILEAAVVKAGLAGALSGNRQLTVFAPTDDAFVALFSELAGAELSEQDVLDAIEAGNLPAGLTLDDVVNILLYHVTAGRRVSPSVVNASKIKMLNGGTVMVDGLELNDGQATIVDPDIKASNGVIHVINGVLLP